MSVSLRLSRGGSKKRPYYKIVIANSTAPRDGKFLEQVGTYNPKAGVPGKKAQERAADKAEKAAAAAEAAAEATAE